MKYQELRDAAKALPEHGEWKASFTMLSQVVTKDGALICKVQKTSSLTDLQNKQRFIAAANPDTLRDLLAELDAKTEALAGLIDDIDDLVNESEGVSGLHLNGDVASWDELLPNGRFERLSNLDLARSLIT